MTSGRHRNGKTMKVAILGPRGNLGHALQKYGYIPIDIDITKGIPYLKGMLEPFDAVINCAAATNLDELETNADKAFAVNYRAVCDIRNAYRGWLIHISTAYVYGDAVETAHNEEDENYNPLGFYASAKLAADMYLQTEMQNTSIVRTTGLFGGHKHDDLVYRFMNTAVSSAPDNLFSQYIHVDVLAECLQHMLLHQNAKSEIINIVNSEYLSRFQLLEMVAIYAKINKEITPKTWQHGYGADRPRHCKLDIGKAQGLNMPIGNLKNGIEKLIINHLPEL